MNSNITLSTLTSRTGLDVFDYLDKEISVPVVNGSQAQGDLIVVPLAVLDGIVVTTERTRHDTRPCRCPASNSSAVRRAAIRTASSPTAAGARGRVRCTTFDASLWAS